MSETKYTKGPWVIELDGTCSGTWPFIRQDGADPDDYPVTELNTTHVIKSRHRNAAVTFKENPKYFQKTKRHDEVMANTRLIAAAPELLEALIALVEFDPSVHRKEGPARYAKARAAITKATA